MNRSLHSVALVSCCTALLALICSSLPAQATDVGLFGFDIRAGIAIPDDHDNGFAVGVSAPVVRWPLKGISLHPGVLYAQADIDLIDDGSANVETSTLGLGLEARYFPSRDWKGLYFGAGPYLFNTDRNVLIPDPTSPSGRRVVGSDNESVGTSILVGYQFGEWGGSFLAEGRVVSTNSFDHFQVLAGYSW